jgi:hypothetical protein
VAPLHHPSTSVSGAVSREPATVHTMSTRQPTSWALRFFVPGYLTLIGVGLIVGAVLVGVYLPDEWFVTLMAAVGGATMLVTTVLLLTVAKDR